MGWAPTRRTNWFRAGQFRRCSIASPQPFSAPTSSGTPFGSRPTAPTNAGRQGNSSTSRRKTPGWANGPGPTGPIENTDLVLMYVFGIHHITRPEDWPVMPVDTVSFWLKPYGFFDRNPSLDVVASPPDQCHTSTTTAHHQSAP